jgi:hypothetical protein
MLLIDETICEMCGLAEKNVSGFTHGIEGYEIVDEKLLLI